MISEALGLDSADDTQPLVVPVQVAAARLEGPDSRDPLEPVSEPLAWFVLRCRLREETRVAELLNGGGFQTFLPQCQLRRRIPGGLRLVTEPLFPGFVFVHIAPGSCDWSLLCNVPGVQQVLRFGTLAPQVPQPMIEGLMHWDGVALEGPGGLAPGEPADGPPSGPLADLQGVLAQREGPARSHLLQEALRRLARAGSATQVTGLPG